MTDLRCIWCDEPVTDRHPVRVAFCGDSRIGDQLIHRECLVRTTVGGAGHQQGLCDDTEDPGPPGMSRHAAAYEAAEYREQQCQREREYLHVLRYLFSGRL